MVHNVHMGMQHRMDRQSCSQTELEAYQSATFILFFAGFKFRADQERNLFTASHMYCMMNVNTEWLIVILNEDHVYNIDTAKL